ncbi:hypothetical protein QPK87_19160 [Kamptonema cortianum]|nr:hypothetical protein [Geitlerinema splendidum]MDK3158675.1 hypothetical protein [Kamptonema cortianum]
MKPNQPIRAVHGGSFFKAIGEDLRDLSVAPDVISADVLDAWYDPSPNVIHRIQEHLPWLIKTSPPTHGDGLRQTIAETRGVPIESIVLGSGTSSLLYLALPNLLASDDTLVILDPSYGEYAHIGQTVIACQIERISLSLQNFKPSVSDIVQQVRATPRAKMLAIVNPEKEDGKERRKAPSFFTWARKG